MAKRFYYGGQAVIEGVMIRGQKAMVTAVRRPSGELSMDIQPLTPIYTSRLRQMPLLRGIIVLIEAISLGIKSLLFSANVSLEEEGEKLTKQSIWLMITAALVLAVGFFFLLPLFLTRLINPYIPSALLFNLIEGLIRLVIFIAYLKIVGLMPDIKRVFTYHGAEHKTVNAFEHSVPLEIEEVKKHNTAHVRCGTSFLFAVLIIAIIVFAIIGRPSLWVMILSRILLIPVIAALGYEVTYFGANHSDNPLVKVILVPGLLLQSMTTGEPDDSQLEVALAALKKVIEIDGREKLPQTSS